MSQHPDWPDDWEMMRESGGGWKLKRPGWAARDVTRWEWLIWVGEPRPSPIPFWPRLIGRLLGTLTKGDIRQAELDGEMYDDYLEAMRRYNGRTRKA